MQSARRKAKVPPPRAVEGARIRYLDGETECSGTVAKVVRHEGPKGSRPIFYVVAEAGVEIDKRSVIAVSNPDKRAQQAAIDLLGRDVVENLVATRAAVRQYEYEHSNQYFPTTEGQNNMTTTALQRNVAGSIQLGSQYGYTPEYVQLIKNTVARDSTDEELQMFISTCHAAKLNPLNREIYFWKQQGKVIIHTGIQGLRIAAERTGCYAPGPPVKREYDENGKLVSSTAYVKKFSHGEWHTIEETALWKEWARDTQQWKGNYGYHQLDITAERHALKKAFPQLAPIALTETMETNGNGSGPHPAETETPEDAERRTVLANELLQIGGLFCDADQFASLKAAVQSHPLATLEERHANAMVRLREHVLGEVGRAYQGNAFGRFLNEALPNGLDAATCDDLFKTLDSLPTSGDLPTHTGPARKGKTETVTAEEVELDDLKSEIMETVSIMADGDLDKIDELLDGRVLNNMTRSQLERFKASLNAEPV